MEVTIEESAKRHGIEDWEIRATIEYPEYKVRLTPRRDGVVPYLFAGQIDNEPPLEIIARKSGDIGQPSDDEAWTAFHAMLLRRSTALRHELDEVHPELFAAIVNHQRK